MLAHLRLSPLSRQVLSIVTFGVTVVGVYLAGYSHGADEMFARLICNRQSSQVVREANDPFRSTVNNLLAIGDTYCPSR